MAELTLGFETGNLTIPDGIRTHADFLRWLAKADIPEEARIGFINGHIRVEPTAERAFAHNQINGEIADIVRPIVRREKLGVYFPDGMLFTSTTAKFSVYPDGLFVSHESINRNRVQLGGAKEDEEDTQLYGSPDLTVEVVSDSSEDKDTEWLMGRYWDAGVREYWVVDARNDPLRFWIFRRNPKGFAAVRRVGGWTKSPVLGRAFRFVEGDIVFGKQEYHLEVAPPAR